MKIVAIVAVIVLVVLVLFLRPRPDISGSNARKLVTQGATLIDVRSANEFASGHVDGAKNIPVDTIGTRLDEIPKDKPVVVYCQSGVRSARAAHVLRTKGYAAVHDLGGIGNW
jgi:rhodanese-related sulfurtransferase